MRSSSWIMPGVALVVWLAAVGYPAVALLGAFGSAESQDVEVHRATSLFLRSTLWALAVALAAVAVGWVPGRLLGKTLARGAYLPVAALVLAPICVPAYVVFYAWWQSWPGDSALYAWAITTGRLPVFKAATLFLGLTCWSWPLVAWCVAGFTAAMPARREELLLLDGAGPWRRLAERFRGDRLGLALGGLIVFLFVFNNTTSFDIAAFYTFGYELKAIDAENAGVRAVTTAAIPAILVAIIGASLIWYLLGRRDHNEAAGRPGRFSRWALIATAVIWVLSTIVPLTLFATNLRRGIDVATFVRLYGGDLANTVTVAVMCGVVGAAVCVGLAATWDAQRQWVRRLAHVQALGWLLAAVIPGTLVGVALEAAYNRPVLDDLVYSGPVVLGLGYLARFAFVGVLLGRWLSTNEPPVLRDLRRLDGAQGLVAYTRATWPRLLAAAGAAFAIVVVLSMSELAVTARLQPSGFGVIAKAVLDAVHYQRPETVLLAMIAFVGVGLAAAVAAVGFWWPLRRFSYRSGAGVVLLAGGVSMLFIGCGGASATDDPVAATSVIFGSPGRSLGQFSKPRAIALDPLGQAIFVVDKTARIQRFGYDGVAQMQWKMPDWENGKPTGLGWASDGRLLVADTHYHRVVVYDRDGRELMRFGSYGKGPGQFIYPTDVDIGPAGRIYVSEYGGNDRIGVFSADGEPLFSFGEFGVEIGMYNRPQALAFSPDQTELYIADSCNHRIVVVTPAGEPLRILGGPGRGPGQLAYPYDVVVQADGTLLVCEYGNNRIQRLSPQGESLGLHGHFGDGPGEFQAPWGVVATGEAIFVLDTGNNRVQRIKKVELR